jgi:hypothetical protein
MMLSASRKNFFSSASTATALHWILLSTKHLPKNPQTFCLSHFPFSPTSSKSELRSELPIADIFRSKSLCTLDEFSILFGRQEAAPFK